MHGYLSLFIIFSSNLATVPLLGTDNILGQISVHSSSPKVALLIYLFMGIILQTGGFSLPFIVMASLILSIFPMIYVTLPQQEGEKMGWFY